MATVPFNMSVHYLIVMEWFRKIKRKEYDSGTGGAPVFSSPDDLDSYLKILATVVKADGSFNGKSKHAERLAVCLQESGNISDAFSLFQEIIGDKVDVLFLNKNPKPYVSEEVADRPGKLGYEGLYRFALAALAQKQEALAARLFLEIVEKTPTYCFPIRLQDVRVNSLDDLQKLGVTKLASGRSVADEYKAADAHQY